jgi:hypothetical protein
MRKKKQKKTEIKKRKQKPKWKYEYWYNCPLVMHKITTCIYCNVNTSEMLHLSISVTCAIVIPPYWNHWYT